MENFLRVLKLDDKNENKTVKLVWSYQNKIAQHEMAIWAFVIARHRKMHDL